MSLVISVQRSLPCAQACDEGIASSSSDAASRASIVTIVCSRSSRMASRTVAAMGPSMFWQGAVLHRCTPFGDESATVQGAHPPVQELQLRLTGRELEEAEGGAEGCEAAVSHEERLTRGRHKASVH